MDLTKLLSGVIKIVKQGGDFIRQEQANFSLELLEYKGTYDLVSYVDRETEKMLVSGLQELLPQAGFITEEGTVSQDPAPLQWVIDPLDGTTNFVHGIPFFFPLALPCCPRVYRYWAWSMRSTKMSASTHCKTVSHTAMKRK